jgi:ATP-dependent DNA ligase
MRIYKKDSKGKLRFLEISALAGKVIQTSGLLKGKPVTHVKECTPKNTGRANATTDIEQADVEAAAIIVKKLQEGYFPTQEAALNTEVKMPMLAESYKEQAHKVVYPCYVQPKLDGIRCNKKGRELKSRANRDITTVKHISNDGDIQSEILDGELYQHGASFQTITSLVKKYVKDETEDIKYHVYDMMSDKPFYERYLMLQELTKNCVHTVVVDTFVVTNYEELVAFHNKFLSEGYEGTMVRWGNAPYKANGRSANLLKYKDFQDVALPIIDVIESDRVPGQGIVVIEYNGHVSKTGSKLSHKQRAELWTNRLDYIGQTAEIRYFEETDKGGLRFPIFLGTRIDK